LEGLLAERIWLPTPGMARRYSLDARFVPLIRNPHALTILGNFWPRKLDFSAFPEEARLYRTEPDVQVLVQSQRPPHPVAELVMVHGLEGSGDAGYMRTLAHAALSSNIAAHRFNMRTCGGTARLCPTLYHAGLTSDLLFFLRQLHSPLPVFLSGFSLGGNVALKLAGELGEEGSQLLAGVCAVSTPIDLAASVRRIAERDNHLYERRFVNRMRDRLFDTGRYTREELARPRSIYEIDDQITAPSFGFGNAENYYATQSSIHFLDRIRIPALLIQAKDDTFIPFESFQHPVFPSNPRLELLATEHGGHVGFLSKNAPRFWIDQTITSWALSIVNTM
jgi:predicted alpha/beta-fold hydrolase